jgi:Reverse transcriptase (RNA-dependent DNA polymerase)
MRDFSFSNASLERIIRSNDLRGIARPQRENIKTDALAAATDLLEFDNRWNTSLFAKGELAKKTIITAESIGLKLLDRKLSMNIRAAFQLRVQNRVQAIRSIKDVLSEGIPVTILRLDIATFFESVQLSMCLEKLQQSRKLDSFSIDLASNFFRNIRTFNDVQHIPRGLSLSSTLADVMLSDFESNVLGLEQLVFYERFVDDIFMMIQPDHDNSTLATLSGLLPIGLAFNESKTECHQIVSGKDPKVLNFNYLGYDFKREAKGTKARADVSLDLSEKKVKKFQTRIAISIVCFSKDGDFDLLKDRVRYLTSNISFQKRGTPVRTLSGIFCNYPEINSQNSNSLRKLDNYLSLSVWNFWKKTERWTRRRIFQSLTEHQFFELTRFKFRNGHTDKIFVYFKPTRLIEIQKAWRDA